jgi:hypothetical protein
MSYANLTTQNLNERRFTVTLQPQEKNERGGRDERNEMNEMKIHGQDKSQRISPDGATSYEG